MAGKALALEDPLRITDDLSVSPVGATGAASTYRATCREADLLSAEGRVHRSAYPEAVCVGDGRWCPSIAMA